MRINGFKITLLISLQFISVHGRTDRDKPKQIVMLEFNPSQKDLPKAHAQSYLFNNYQQVAKLIQQKDNNQGMFPQDTQRIIIDEDKQRAPMIYFAKSQEFNAESIRHRISMPLVGFFTAVGMCLGLALAMAAVLAVARNRQLTEIEMRRCNYQQLQRSLEYLGEQRSLKHKIKSQIVVIGCPAHDKVTSNGSSIQKALYNNFDPETLQLSRKTKVFQKPLRKSSRIIGSTKTETIGLQTVAVYQDTSESETPRSQVAKYSTSNQKKSTATHNSVQASAAVGETKTLQQHQLLLKPISITSMRERSVKYGHAAVTSSEPIQTIVPAAVPNKPQQNEFDIRSAEIKQTSLKNSSESKTKSETLFCPVKFSSIQLNQGKSQSSLNPDEDKTSFQAQELDTSETLKPLQSSDFLEIKTFPPQPESGNKSNSKQSDNLITTPKEELTSNLIEIESPPVPTAYLYAKQNRESLTNSDYIIPVKLVAASTNFAEEKLSGTLKTAQTPSKRFAVISP